MRRATSGFTLIEILVAMTILFATVVTGVMAFQNNMQNSVKAAEVTHILTQLDTVRSNIKFNLQHDGQTSGSELFSQDVEIAWQAEQIAYLPPAPFYDDGLGAYNQYGQRYRLYAITLNMNYGSTQRTFNYEELVWDETIRQAASP
ncbi:prepilin-type N-terminal cleavage/methylation domain-containing protein [Pseudidiomarina sp. 1ASP75-14]|uniref:type IV pilus modification PilV family protein n=1 Tax=Pseudidiomarina terrestris TaxID=2820060 RepID=UPI00264E3053|nr:MULTISPECIES: prepilin-type N-terminal cleavage/methylation domain-containing protein [unclassified Pseudidiomarina]MDN7126981.1 prepilin-type N-terminal cleavage/methylation domain-containing protein [Pseudidiomarina sp. 1APR75-33.1]MDN7136822.1 prepilin-type N-terminal cleavage/methylation domain-containing protein [Pseudidiomarina sp. 1ASP75-14]